MRDPMTMQPRCHLGPELDRLLRGTWENHCGYTSSMFVFAIVIVIVIVIAIVIVIVIVIVIQHHDLPTFMSSLFPPSVDIIA